MIEKSQLLVVDFAEMNSSNQKLFRSVAECFSISACFFTPADVDVCNEQRSNFIVNLLGQWQESDFGNSNAIPVGGLAYYLSPPQSALLWRVPRATLRKPIHSDSCFEMHHQSELLDRVSK